MLCAAIQSQGPPENLKLTECPTPQPGPRDVLVRIHASSINPIDTYLRSGAIPMPIKLPYIPGCDLAGAVEAVGAEVTRFRPGDRVWGSNQGLFGRQGALAQYSAVHEDWLYHTPANMTDAQAAAGALTGITAHLGLFLNAQLQPGELVLVNGGSGGVGTMVIQFAKAAGAKVIAIAGLPDKQALCRKLGADVVLDYRSPTLDDQIKQAASENGGLDIWWETQREPTLPRTIGLMKKRGRIILMAGRQAELTFTLGAFYTNDLKMLGFAMFNASPSEQRVAAEQMNRWFEQGRWAPQIGATFPLREAAQAHQLQESNTLQKQGSLTGKIVVTIE